MSRWMGREKSCSAIGIILPTQFSALCASSSAHSGDGAAQTPYANSGDADSEPFLCLSVFHIYSYIMPCLLQPHCSSMHITRSEAISCCHWILFWSASSSCSISAWISELAVKLCVRFHLLLSGITFPSIVLYNKKNECRESATEKVSYVITL